MKRRKGKVWDHIESLGLLERGTEAEILSAKKSYRKSYLTAQKQKQRSCRPTFSVGLSKDTGEYETLIEAAKKHGIPISAFIKDAALAYQRQTFLVPKHWQLHELSIALHECINEIKAIAVRKEHFWETENKIDKIEKRITKLEAEVHRIFAEPPLIQK